MAWFGDRYGDGGDLKAYVIGYEASRWALAASTLLEYVRLYQVSGTKRPSKTELSS